MQSTPLLPHCVLTKCSVTEVHNERSAATNKIGMKAEPNWFLQNLFSKEDCHKYPSEQACPHISSSLPLLALACNTKSTSLAILSSQALGKYLLEESSLYLYSECVTMQRALLAVITATETVQGADKNQGAASTKLRDACPDDNGENRAKNVRAMREGLGESFTPFPKEREGGMREVKIQRKKIKEMTVHKKRALCVVKGGGGLGSDDNTGQGNPEKPAAAGG